MTAIVCEMCGSQDLVKQDGVYICQNCGTKYTPEEAKKLINGTVKIDNSERLENLFSAARSARSISNYEQAAKYYTEIRTLQPSSWEATFYSVYCVAASCRVFQIESAAQSVNSCLGTTFSLIDSGAEDKKAAKIDVATSTIAIAKAFQSTSLKTFNDLCANLSGSQADTIIERFKDYANRIGPISILLLTIGECIEKDNSQLACTAWKLGIEYVNTIYQLLDSGARDANYEWMVKYQEKIKKYEPLYSIPTPNYSIYASSTQYVINWIFRRRGVSNGGQTSSGGGCYVATAVYGSYDCPQVWTLRRYRDYTLAETWYGRAFIHTYYAVSPTLVKWFGNTDWFKKLWHPRLDRMVERLNAEGVENTPYADRDW